MNHKFMQLSIFLFIFLVEGGGGGASLGHSNPQKYNPSVHQNAFVGNFKNIYFKSLIEVFPTKCNSHDSL